MPAAFFIAAGEYLIPVGEIVTGGETNLKKPDRKQQKRIKWGF